MILASPGPQIEVGGGGAQIRRKKASLGAFHRLFQKF